jgi:DNA polymerase III sliding clamp (beta) subunit (PCNA family)
MSAQDVGSAQESVDAKFEGTELTVAFNPTFLHDGIDAVDTEEIVLHDAVDPSARQHSPGPTRTSSILSRIGRIPA